MATVKDDLANWTLDDLLEAINPAPPTPEERVQRALAVIARLQQEGQITDADADAWVRAIIAARINGEFAAMVSDYFTPAKRRRADDARRRGFSLL